MVKCSKETQNVKVDVGGYGIVWTDELDLAAEELWEEGVATGKVYEVDIKLYVGQKLQAARKSVGMTQKELSRGLANPSIQTLQKLAEGLGMKLKIEFENSPF